jgi:hypothetical protein
VKYTSNKKPGFMCNTVFDHKKGCILCSLYILYTCDSVLGLKLQGREADH